MAPLNLLRHPRLRLRVLIDPNFQMCLLLMCLFLILLAVVCCELVLGLMNLDYSLSLFSILVLYSELWSSLQTLTIEYVRGLPREARRCLGRVNPKPRARAAITVNFFFFLYVSHILLAASVSVSVCRCQSQCVTSIKPKTLATGHLILILSLSAQTPCQHTGKRKKHVCMRTHTTTTTMRSDHPRMYTHAWRANAHDKSLIHRVIATSQK